MSKQRVCKAYLFAWCFFSLMMLENYGIPAGSEISLAILLLFASTYATYLWLNSQTYQLRHIPTSGTPGLFGSYLDAWKFFLRGQEMVQKGYEKFPATAFKVSTIGRYFVIVSGAEMYNDIRKATDEYLSLREAAAETLQLDYMLGSQIRLDPFHVRAVRTDLTRNLGERFPDIIDELSTAFSEFIPAGPGQRDWVEVPVLNTVTQVVCRTSNRMFVGLPLCRDPEYHELQLKFTPEVIKGGLTINLFPQALRPLVGRWLTKVPQNVDRLVSFIGPLIQERLEKEREFGDAWPDKPNDMLSWLLDIAQGPQKATEEIAVQLFSVTFGAIHTTSMALTHAIYDLAAHPEYVSPLREEIEHVIEAEGWTKHAQGKMHKLDSFVKESQRMSTHSMSMTRLVLKDFTFSNGVTVPSGALIAFAALDTQHDEDNFKDARTFQGFRFADTQSTEENANNQMVALSSDYVVFGAGHNACPGRFFASNELKAMLVYILLNYDIKLVDENQRPANMWFAGICSPHPTAKVLFRRRTII